MRNLDAAQLELQYIGALRSGERVHLPQPLVEELNHQFRQPLDRRRHVLIAEPAGGERLWVVSENLIERGGRVSHRLRDVIISERMWRQVHRQTIEEYVARNWNAIRADLSQKLRELEHPPTPLTDAVADPGEQ